jgi:hypothetical protein
MASRHSVKLLAAFTAFFSVTLGTGYWIWGRGASISQKPEWCYVATIPLRDDAEGKPGVFPAMEGISSPEGLTVRILYGTLWFRHEIRSRKTRPDKTGLLAAGEKMEIVNRESSSSMAGPGKGKLLSESSQAYSGTHRAGPLFNRDRLALMSYSGGVQPLLDYLPLPRINGGGNPSIYHATVFVDIYASGSGARLATLQGFSGADRVTDLFLRAGWIGENVFVMALPSVESILVCEVPNS